MSKTKTLDEDSESCFELLMKAKQVRYLAKMTAIKVESDFGKMLALHLCGDEEKFEDYSRMTRFNTRSRPRRRRRSVRARGVGG